MEIMKQLTDEIEDIKLVFQQEMEPDIKVAPGRHAGRSVAQQIRDDILETAEDKFREARDLIAEGLEMFALLTTPQHRNLATLVGQQIEQVIEYRRVHL